jgi:mono/diheme cytochrome c family protein
VAAVLLAGLVSAAHHSTASEDADEDAIYRGQVLPILERYCVRCHKPEKAKGGLNLARYPELVAVRRDRKSWERLIENVESEIMPPDGEEAPSPEVRRHLAHTLQSLLSKGDCTVPQPGRVTLRRLNRVEYNNTVRDLLGVDLRPADEFPVDDVGYGFDTIGDVLSLPPMLLEKYLTAAERLAEAAVVVPRPAGGLRKQWSARELEGDASDAPGGRRLASNGELAVAYTFSDKGKYRLRVRAYGEQAGAEPVKMAVRLDGSVQRTFEVKAVAGAPGEYECELAIAHPGSRRIALAFLNDFFQPQKGDSKQLDRNMVVCGLELRSGQTGFLWPIARWDAASLGGGERVGNARILTSSGEFTAAFDAPGDGRYTFEFTAYGTQAGDEPVRVGVVVDGKPIRTVDVPAVESEPGRYWAVLPLGHGRHTIGLAFLNDYYVPDDPDPKKRGDRNLFVTGLEVAGSVPGALPESHRRLIVRFPKNDADWRAAASESLHPFLERAYRRPARDEDVQRVVELVELAHKDGEPFERGIQVALEAVLVSPQFLYRVELDRRKKAEGSDPGPVRPLTDWELASRLSYFLWSTMPDAELLRLARDKRLQDDATLEAQTRRLLADSRSRALIENFAGQWLQLRLLKNVSPDTGRFPAFSNDLRSDMVRETELFLDSIVHQDRSLLELIDSDDVFVNERLAKHYGIEGVSGEEFRRVKLPAGHPRGGLLTQASILTLTSNPTRTSPVKRGKYLLEQILGTPPPPPPPNVPDLDAGKKGPLSGTLRERMEQHRANPSCAACHAKLDPLGFGFENFDAIGAWRDREGDTVVDASGVLPGGVKFEGIKGLKKYLSTQRADRITRTLAEKLLTYGLGRGLEPSDACAVDAIVQAAAEDSHRFSRLVVAIVQSDPFRKRTREELPLP